MHRSDYERCSAIDRPNSDSFPTFERKLPSAYNRKLGIVKDRYHDDLQPLERESVQNNSIEKKQKESAVEDTSGEDALVIGLARASAW